MWDVGYDELSAELVAMADEDHRVRDELIAEGVLYDGYQPRMRAVHDENAQRLREIIQAHGWPDRTQVGDRAAEAAWLIVHHAIGHPSLQRTCLPLLQAAAERGDASAVQAAMLEDRICEFEGRPQVYGTQFDWDADGLMSPLPIDDETHVDERRRRIGLPPLAEATAQQRADVTANGASAPHDRVAATNESEAWARSVGWR